MPSLDSKPRFIELVARSQPWRLGPRGLLIGAFAASVLVALSGAFLIGLAVVGVVAVASPGSSSCIGICGPRPKHRPVPSITRGLLSAGVRLPGSALT